MIDQTRVADVLDMEVFEPEKKQLPVIQETDPNVETDFAYARSNIYQFMEAGKDALQEAMQVASESESPRGFEVVGGLLKNLSEINKQIMDIHEQKQKITAPKETTQTVNNNAVFVGSTAELMKLLGK